MGLRFKVLAVDLDGTLVQKNNRISHKNVAAIKQFTDLGGILIFVTGRSLDSAIQIAKKIQQRTNYCVPYICAMNSTIIYDNINGKVLFQKLIPQKIVEQIFRYAKHNKAVFGAYTEEVSRTNQMPIYGWGRLPALISLFKNNETIQLRNWNEKTMCQAAYKINFMFRFKPRTEILAFMRTKYAGKLEIVTPSSHLNEITSFGINKAFGVKFIAEELKISPSEIAAIGDSENDIPMFQVCGLKIAARTKHQAIIPYVDFTIAKPQKDAVSKAILTYLIQ